MCYRKAYVALFMVKALQKSLHFLLLHGTRTRWEFLPEFVSDLKCRAYGSSLILLAGVFARHLVSSDLWDRWLRVETSLSCMFMILAIDS